MIALPILISLSMLAQFGNAPETPAADPGSMTGTVIVGLETATVELAHLGPVVAYLECLGKPPLFELPAKSPRIQQKNARFHPDFLVVTRGQTVEMPNDDKIYHNVFSYSKPNAFDLGLYRQGTSRSVKFEHTGVVKLYCSIHESMNGVIFVAPSPYYTRVAKDGSFTIAGVPPGEYQLSIWCERLPVKTVKVEVKSAESTVCEIRVPLGGPTEKKDTSRIGGSSNLSPSSASEGSEGTPTTRSLEGTTRVEVRYAETDCCTPRDQS